MSNTVLSDMPTTIHSFVVENDDDTYTIVLNSRMSHADNCRAYMHELRHISEDDFSGSDVNVIEAKAHK